MSLGFLKPYGAKPVSVEGVYTDGDAWQIAQALGLKESPAECCTVLRSQDLLAKALRGEVDDNLAKVKASCQKLAKGKDVLLMCGAGTLRSGAMFGLSGYNTVLELGAKAVIVERYENDFFLDDLLSAAYRLGDNLAGVIINAVDPEMNDVLEEQVLPFLRMHGVAAFGCLPKDDLLSAISVGELAEILSAQPITAVKHGERLIKRFFIGAMQVSHASRFFGGVHDFACIVGGDRPDMQIAAIQAGAACLILTGNFYPSDLIISQAEEKAVPVLMVRGDTFTSARLLDSALRRGSLAQPDKQARAVAMVDRGVDFAALYAKLGLKTK